MSIGIYSLYWEKPDLIYIGQSSNIESRFKQHLYLLKNNKHYNSKLQDTYNKFGDPENNILYLCKLDLLDKEEIAMIEEFNSFYGINGLNLSIGGGSLQGENHPNSIYINDLIVEVFFYLIDRSMSHKDISTKLGVSVDTIKAISYGKEHTWLKDKYPDEYASLISSKKQEHNIGEDHPACQLTNKQIEQIFFALVSRDTSLVEISKRLDVTYSVVTMISCGAQYKWLRDKYPIEYKIMLDNRDKSTKVYPLITNGIETIQVTNATSFCAERGLQISNLSKVFKGIRGSHKGWKLKERSVNNE